MYNQHQNRCTIWPATCRFGAILWSVSADNTLLCIGLFEKVVERVDNEQGARGSQELKQSTDDRIYVDKRALVTFIEGVINSTAEVK